MRICQVIPDLPMGGAETMCVTLSIELKKMGHDVSVISLYDCDSILTRRLKDAQIPTYFMSKRPGLDLQCIPRLRSCLRKLRPDVIHTHIHALKYTYIACLGLKIPMLRTIHSVASMDAEADTSVNRFLFSHGLVTPVAISDAIRDTTVSYYGLKEGSVPVIINGVDLSRCIPKNDYAIDGAVKLLHVGRFHEAKNHDCMVNAVKLLTDKGIDIQFSFFGDGELEDTTRQLVANLGLESKIRFCGLTDNVFPHLHDADIFLLPSKWEGIPMSIIEAMGTGLPVIASRVGGVPDMIEDGVDGVLIEPTGQALADAIEKLLQDYALRKALGENARLSANRFSAATMANAYCELYTRLADRKDSRR